MPERANQRANGVRLWATSTDCSRLFLLARGPSGDVGRRRNTQKIWFPTRDDPDLIAIDQIVVITPQGDRIASMSRLVASTAAALS